MSDDLKRVKSLLARAEFLLLQSKIEKLEPVIKILTQCNKFSQTLAKKALLRNRINEL